MKSSTPLVSVVIPSYNYAHFLGSCIESALSQTYPNIEVLVVDDGSQDETVEVVRRYPGVRYFHQPHNGNGTCRAMNYGIREAKGEVIAWLSSDDRFLPDKIARQVEALKGAQQQDPHVCMVYSNVWVEATDEAGLKFHPHPAPEHLRELQETGGVRWEVTYPRLRPDNALALMLTANVVNGCTTLIDRNVFDDIGFFDEALPRTGDVEMWVRMLAAGYRFHFHPESLTIQRFHEENSRTWHECQAEYNLTRRKIRDRYPIERIIPMDDSRQAHHALGTLLARTGAMDAALAELRLAGLSESDPLMTQLMAKLPPVSTHPPLDLPTSKSLRLFMAFEEGSDVARCHLALSHYIQAFKAEDDISLVVWIPANSPTVLEAFANRFEAVCTANGLDPEREPHAEILLMVDPGDEPSMLNQSRVLAACRVFLPLGCPQDDLLFAQAQRSRLGIAYEATRQGLLGLAFALNPTAIRSGWCRLRASNKTRHVTDLPRMG